MSWKLRHQGSPQQVENLSLAQVIEGLQDGLWEPTDEVMGPQDRRWVPLEAHPQFAEIALDLETEARPSDDAEERLDMNPLIDVCLVLLVFFILTTTYHTLEKVLRVPESKPANPGALTQVSPEQVKQFMIMVEAVQRDRRPVYRVEGQEVAEANLEKELRRYVRETRKTELVIDAQGVTCDAIAKIIDAATGARIQKVHFKAGTTPPSR